MNQMNQIHHSRMGLTSYLFYAYDAFSSFYFSFFYVPSLMTTNLTNQMMVDKFLSSLSVRAFCILMLNYFLINSFLVKSQYIFCSSIWVILSRVWISLVFSRYSIFSRSNTLLVLNSESLINLRYANVSLIVSISPWVTAISMLLSVGFQIPSLFAILVATPPLLRSSTLYVCMGGCLKDRSYGVWTLREFARFIRSLESNFLMTLWKILPEYLLQFAKMSYSIHW